MAVDNVTVNSNVGVDGNSYTTSISNDQLTNEDFLALMIQELKLQDPTKPMDSQQMLSTQMQMSTIDTNQKTLEAMESLTTTFTQNALASASNVIGQNVEDGNISDSGINKAYTVRSVQSVDGQIQVKAQEILYLEDQMSYTDSDGNISIINYDVDGTILDENGLDTGYKVALQNPGQPLLSNGKPVILDENNDQLSEHSYALTGVSAAVYSDILTDIPFSSITKIF